MCTILTRSLWDVNNAEFCLIHELYIKKYSTGSRAAKRTYARRLISDYKKFCVFRLLAQNLLSRFFEESFNLAWMNSTPYDRGFSNFAFLNGNLFYEGAYLPDSIKHLKQSYFSLQDLKWRSCISNIKHEKVLKIKFPFSRTMITCIGNLKSFDNCCEIIDNANFKITNL